MKAYPLLFEPVLKDYLWGGRSLERLFGRRLPPGPTAESWEISGHPDGETVVANGPAKGIGLADLHRRLGAALAGRRAAGSRHFPLLIKLLDAADRLSLQVHPGDEFARERENGQLGKSEMWVVLHADPGAAVILGVRAGTDARRFRAAADAGALEPLLHTIPIQAGDFVCVPSTSLHAILGRAVIAEIQQSSNITYRVFDWNRAGPDGRPRQLHLEKALQVINFDQIEPALPRAQPLGAPAGVGRWLLCRNEHFLVERLEVGGAAAFGGACNGESLEIWGTIAGDATVTGGDESVALPAVRFVLLPATLGAYQIVNSADVPATLLRVYLP
jgi:mannose-6-phosphate isomerase